MTNPSTGSAGTKEWLRASRNLNVSGEHATFVKFSIVAAPKDGIDSGQSTSLGNIVDRKAVLAGRRDR